MLKVVAMVFGVMHLLAFPVSASQFLDRLPSVTKEKAESYGKRHFDGTGFISIKHTYAALVDGHYYAYGEVECLKGTNVCDLEGLAPVLLNMCLERIPNSMVRVSVNSLTTAPGNPEGSSENSGELSPEEFAREIRVVEIGKS